MASAILKLSPVATYPRLSARNAAKFLSLNALEQKRLLEAQKYPLQTPKIIYYAPPIAGIRGFLESGPSALAGAYAQIQSIRVASRRMHCLRVLKQFVDSDHAKRGLKPVTSHRYSAHLHDLELRLSPDLWAMEGDEERVIYFNANLTPQDAEQARKTLEIAHWLLEQNHLSIKPEQIEFIDLGTGALHKFKKPRAKTMKDLAENAKLIGDLWPML
jgi:hypothetical protein